MPDHIQITFTDITPEQQEWTIAHLAEAGFEGFEENEHELKAFIGQENYDPALMKELAYKYQLNYNEETIPEQNWNEVWESNFQPVIVDDFVAIRAGFHKPITGVEHEIVITPKMSFGTGHHATTNMMIRQMREIDFTGKSVFDFGTGTGVLAILAEKLGASAVLAIDNDEWSISNAIENIQLNNCLLTRIVGAGSLEANDKYDIMLANINKNTILDHFTSLIQHLEPCGILLLSGVLQADREDILTAANQHHVKITGEISQGDWLCVRINH